VNLAKKFEKNVQLQNYDVKNKITGVKIIPLKRFNDETGSLTELVRLNNGSVEDLSGFELKQVNFSEIDRWAIKAFHVHKEQTDIWYVPPANKILLILVDLREDSSTQDNRMRMVLGDGESRLVLIPPGIAHGCKNLSNHKSEIIYLVDKKFDPEPKKCDEWRLNWDHFGENIWELSKE